MEQFEKSISASGPKISLIIPAYNAERYIYLTLDSILKQRGAEMVEVIVVNDGSTDGTQEILDAYVKSGGIRVVDTANMGPANARNAGISAARGEYIMFADSDDTLCDGALEAVMAELQGDLLIFGFRIVNEKHGGVLSYFYENTGNVSREEFGRHLIPMYQKNLLNQVWNKAYRKSVITDNGILFQDYKYGEDRLFVFDVIKCAGTVKVIDGLYYNYYIRDNDSLVSKFYSDKFKVCCEIDDKIRALAAEFGTLDGENTGVLNCMFVKSEVSCLTNLFERTCPLSRGEKRTAIKEILKNEKSRAAVKALPDNCGMVYKLVSQILSLENVTLNYLFAFTATKGIKLLPVLFVKIKHADNVADNK